MAIIVGVRPPIAPHNQTTDLRLRLLGGFSLEVGGSAVDLPHSAQRFIAFLALHPRAVQRKFVAGSLWLDTPDGRAAGNLRSALWRVRGVHPSIVVMGRGTVRLSRDATVDVRHAYEAAHRWIAGQPTDEDMASGSAPLDAELLPDWYDEWVVDERDKFRQLRLHALEAIAENLSERGHYAEALLAALDAAREDPLRESAHRALIRVHLAEGNIGEAIRQLRRCEEFLNRELGVRPSPGLEDLVWNAIARAG